MKTEKCWENLINGNLGDAKRQARTIPAHELEIWAADNLSWSEEKTLRAIAYLKGIGSFQAYCDAK